jgi:hypothetical protein
LPSAAAAQEISITGGGSYSKGRHDGAEPTEAVISFGILQANYSGWLFSAALPHVTVATGGTVVEVSGLLVPTGGEKISGFGDLVLELERDISLGSAVPVEMVLSGRLKVPTGFSRISTGKADAGFNVGVSTKTSVVSPFVKLGYRFYGDTPELNLSDGWVGSAGATSELGNLALLISYVWEESAFNGPTSKELYALVSGPLQKGWQWTIFGSNGLSAGAADFTVGVALTHSFSNQRTKVRPRR